MSYFVTGATGLVGSHVVHQLVENGHNVVALTRSRSNADHLPPEATIVEGDVTEKASMREAMDGVDGVFHIAAWVYVGPGPDNVAKAEQINVEGTRNVLELIDELDIPKGVYTSTVGIFADESTDTVDESHAPDDPPPSVYLRTKWEAHYEVAKPLMDEGLPLVTVMPGNVFGRWDKPYGSFRGVFRSYLQEALPMIPRHWEFPFEHAEDTARSHIRAMEHGDPGEEYIIAAESRTLIDIFDHAEDITGVPAPRAATSTIFSVFASVMGVVERVITPPEGFESETLEFLSDNKVLVDNSKARAELGIEHRPFADALGTYLEWEQDQLAQQM